MSWLEVELVLDGELAEPVAELLARYCQGGLAITQDGTSAGPIDSAGAVAVRGYLPRDSALSENTRRIEQGLWHLGRIQDLPAPSYREIEDQDWNARWREHYRPLEIGHSLIILPSWVEAPATDRLPVRIEPGMAFGTGTHPSTRLALLAIETAVQPESNFADIGTGSGILSVAALKLGARQAFGVDRDRQAVKLARRNAGLNGLSGQFQATHGTIESLIPVGRRLHGFDMLAANILAPILVELLEDGMADLVRSGGSMVLSGILEEQRAAIEFAVHGSGLQMRAQLQEADWVAFLLTKK